MAEGKKGGWGAERREESSLFSCHCLLSASKSEEITRKVNHVAHSEKCLRSQASNQGVFAPAARLRRSAVTWGSVYIQGLLRGKTDDLKIRGPHMQPEPDGKQKAVANLEPQLQSHICFIYVQLSNAWCSLPSQVTGAKALYAPHNVICSAVLNISPVQEGRSGRPVSRCPLSTYIATPTIALGLALCCCNWRDL